MDAVTSTTPHGEVSYTLSCEGGKPVPDSRHTSGAQPRGWAPGIDEDADELMTVDR